MISPLLLIEVSASFLKGEGLVRKDATLTSGRGGIDIPPRRSRAVAV